MKTYVIMFTVILIHVQQSQFPKIQLAGCCIRFIHVGSKKWTSELGKKSVLKGFMQSTAHCNTTCTLVRQKYTYFFALTLCECVLWSHCHTKENINYGCRPNKAKCKAAFFFFFHETGYFFQSHSERMSRGKKQ